MTTLFKKLNLKDQREIIVVNMPAGFEESVFALDDVTVREKPSKWSTVEFVIFFVQTLKQVREAARRIEKTENDPVIWMAYPKGSSKQYTCEFNRDTGWQSLGDAGFEGVRQVAIDSDWSALRFRRAEYIRSMTRDSKRAISKQGKSRTSIHRNKA